MKKYNLLVLGILAVGCNKSNSSDTKCGAGTSLVNGVCTVPAATKTYVQVDHLGRPGINEALLITNDFHNGYNATAPSFTGVPKATLDTVVGEAKTVLKAIYLGSCFVSGELGLTTTNALKPAAVQCAQVGAAVFSDSAHTVIATDAAASAQTYADKTFTQFVPDVMRINTSAPSGYLSPCSLTAATDSKQLLCGGRLIDDDVIDVTYNYLIGGLAGQTSTVDPSPLGTQVRALTSDGVAFDNTAKAGEGNNKNGLSDGVASNTQQGHTAPSSTFPYSAPPF